MKAIQNTSKKIHIRKQVAGGATGAVLGAVVGGPVGAVVGGVLGTAVGTVAERGGLAARSRNGSKTPKRHSLMRVTKRAMKPAKAKATRSRAKSKKARTTRKRTTRSSR